MCPLSLSEIPLDRQAHASHDHGVIALPPSQLPTELVEVETTPEQVEVLVPPPGAWWPTVRPDLERAAAQAAGRALLDSWAMPDVGDPSVLDQVALEAVGAAASVARDPAVDGSVRLAAVVEARRVTEVLSSAHERAEARRERWWAAVRDTLIGVTGAAFLAALLKPKEV